MTSLESRVRGAALGAFRRLRGWTGKELGSAAGCSEQMVSHYECGEKELSPERYLFFGQAMDFSPRRLESAAFGLGVRDWELKEGKPGEAGPAAPLSAAEAAARLQADEALRRRRAAEMAALAATHTADRILHRARARQVAWKARREAEALCRALLRLKPERQEIWLAEEPAFQGWAVVERLGEASAALASSDPERARQLANWNVRAAQESPETLEKARKVGFAGFFYGNALRVCSDLKGAHAVFEESWASWEAGEGPGAPPFAGWRPYDLEASLRRDQDLWSTAVACSNRALALAPPHGPTRARILIKKASCLQLAGAHPRALPILTEAVGSIDVEREPRLAQIVHFNFAVGLHEMGRNSEASGHLSAARILASELESPLDLARCDWLAARVAVTLGEPQEALAAFARAREGFATQRVALDCASVALQESILLLEAGESGRAKRIAAAVAWAFADQSLVREAREALEVYCRAAEREEATVELARWAHSRLTPGRPALGATIANS